MGNNNTRYNHQGNSVAFKSNKTQYKASSREFRSKPNMIINNNINIGQINPKENKFKGNIKISIDFYDSKHSNQLRGEQNLYDKKALKKSKESGFYSKKNSVSRLEKRRPKEFYSISKAKSGGLSPNIKSKHKRVPSGTEKKKFNFASLNVNPFYRGD